MKAAKIPSPHWNHSYADMNTCPRCGGQSMGCNVGKEHWQTCDACRVRWWVGSGLCTIPDEDFEPLAIHRALAILHRLVNVSDIYTESPFSASGAANDAFDYATGYGAPAATAPTGPDYGPFYGPDFEAEIPF
jgi:hypothetical protein